MADACHVLCGGAVLEGDAGLVDHIAGVRANDVAAQDAVRRGIAEDLDEAVSVVCGREGTGVAVGECVWGERVLARMGFKTGACACVADARWMRGERGEGHRETRALTHKSRTAGQTRIPRTVASIPLHLAREFAAKGNLPTLYLTPSSLSCSSDLPTHATSGCVYTTEGTQL